ncbi:MAG TPA: AMP-binding protein, partial [Thermoanaerobaculia bacterium]|nr:AMP-binding protein [Thermoanaerobaculia bacterium]
MTPQDPILRAFERIVRHDPLAPLVASPERRATTGDVDALARAAGTVLRDGTLALGTVVGLAAANGPGFLASVVALRRAGLAVLLLDARTPDSEALRILGSLGAPALLRCPGGWPAGPRDWTFTALDTIAAAEPAHPAEPEIGFIKLTSGS